MDKLERIFDEQAKLQLAMPSGDPAKLDDEQKIEFIRWNVLALEDELHEALQEVGWKPWASSRHINRDQYRSELVDALHFFVNLCLVAEIDAGELFSWYLAKRNTNERRQLAGYTGTKEKCSGCHRDLDELPPDHVFIEGKCLEARVPTHPIRVCERCQYEHDASLPPPSECQGCRKLNTGRTKVRRVMRMRVSANAEWKVSGWCKSRTSPAWATYTSLGAGVYDVVYGVRGGHPSDVERDGMTLIENATYHWPDDSEPV